MHAAAATSRRCVGLGYLPDEARHGFDVYVPKGTAKSDLIRIVERRGEQTQEFDALERPDADSSMKDPSWRVLINRARWQELAPFFWEEANRRLRGNGLPTHKYQKSYAQPVIVHPSLGKELCVLCWAVEEAPPDSIPNALRNWDALAPEERWWLYTMTVAATGQAMQKGVGWRKALRAALADNPFVKGDGLSPKSRRELLGQNQLSLGL